MYTKEDLKQALSQMGFTHLDSVMVHASMKSIGEVEAAKNLREAADIMAGTPGALHLRTLSTLNDISSDQSNTVVFAIPLEILRAFESSNLKETIKKNTKKEK